MNQLVPIVSRYGGHVIAGTCQTGHLMGVRRPTFIFLAQWRSRESFFSCNAEGKLVSDFLSPYLIGR